MGRKKLKDDPDYQKLVADLKQIIADAKAKGVPLFERDDLLTCDHCGAYEDVLTLNQGPAGKKRVFLNPKFETESEFAVLDSKERRVRAPKGKVRYRKTYTFICGVCGAHQKESFIDEFDEL